MLKEKTDNALDNGPGIDPAKLALLFSVNRPLISSKRRTCGVSGRAMSSLIVGSAGALAHVQTFCALVDDFICDIGAGAFENVEYADSRMVIEHQNVVLLAVRYLGTPVALLISEYATELARRHAVMFATDPHADEFLKVYRLARRLHG